METLQPTLLKMTFSTNMRMTSNMKNIAMFDLDHCIIRPQEGRTFPRSSSDWEWVFPNVPDVLKTLEKTHRVVVITNQARTEKDPKKRQAKIDELEKKLKDVFKGHNLEVYIPIAKDQWRKPNTAIFEKYILHQDVLSPESISDIEAFYVGDAAGRPKDHSDSDRAFAYNLYLLFKHICIQNGSKLLKSMYPKFYTETEYFQKQLSNNKSWKSFNTTEYLQNNPPTSNNVPVMDPAKKWLILMVGAPASGKSTIAKNLTLPNKVIISQDVSGTKRKTFAKVREALANGKNVVVDNTNPTKEIRKEIIDLLVHMKNHLNYSTAIIMADTPRPLVMHLNSVRVRHGGVKIPKVAYNVFYKKFEYPYSVDADIVMIVPFTPVFKTNNDVLRFVQRTESY